MPQFFPRWSDSHSKKSGFTFWTLIGLGIIPPGIFAQSQPSQRPSTAQSANGNSAVLQNGNAQPQARSANNQTSSAPQKSPEELARLAQRMNILLAAWEERSALVKELDAEFTRNDKSPAWQEETDYKGRALLKSPDLAYLDFEKLDPASKKHVHHERIICTGKEVFHYQTASRQIFIFPLSAEERTRALEEGPLPFLFNMKADKAKLRYKMSLLSENANGAWIQILPLEKIDQESFSKVYVLLNKEKFLPDQLIIWAPNGKDTQYYKFGTIKVNSGIVQKNFEGTILKDWDVVRNPSASSQPSPGATNQPVPRVGRLTPGSGGGATQPQYGGTRSTAAPKSSSTTAPIRR